jgi:hypothetical protein
MTGKIDHPEDKHPAEYQSDLNLEAGQGQGDAGPGPAQVGPRRSAFDLKEAHDLLKGFTDDELRRIAVLPEGSRLEPGATYLDLKDPTRRAFTGGATVAADGDHWYVPKAEVDYPLWNRLIGVREPERRDRASG